jgi:hypothetical protein
MRNPRKSRPLVAGPPGQGLTEYIVLLLLVSIISIGVVKALGSTIKSKIMEARNQINHHVSVYQDN